MEYTDNTTDVLVVGAGPTGLVMALELARRGIACRIIDRLPVATQTSKALAVQSRTLEVFDMMGIVEGSIAAWTPGRCRQPVREREAYCSCAL